MVAPRQSDNSGLERCLCLLLVVGIVEIMGTWKDLAYTYIPLDLYFIQLRV
jgi:hypothetical protein